LTKTFALFFQLFTGQDGDRVEASDVVILLADGGAHDRTQALENAAKLKRRGVHVVTIYIPNSTSDEKFKENLRDIASSHNNFYTLNFYEPKYVAADLFKNVCSKK
jgi:pyruvate-formate lyase-activating enzyme